MVKITMTKLKPLAQIAFSLIQLLLLLVVVMKLQSCFRTENTNTQQINKGKQAVISIISLVINEAR